MYNSQKSPWNGAFFLRKIIAKKLFTWYNNGVNGASYFGGVYGLLSKENQTKK